MMGERPDLDEVLSRTFERVEHALRQADESFMTDDCMEPLDPVHAYAKTMVAEALPVATLGLFIVLARMNGVRPQ
jgi:hypothetical protein